MESKVAVLENKVETLEQWALKHERDDERAHKYQNNMLEDFLARLAGIERSAARFETDLLHRNGSDLDTKVSLKEIFERIRVLERLAYIAIGGLGVIGALASFFGWQVLKLLGK